jgi:hypothetical protein
MMPGVPRPNLQGEQPVEVGGISEQVPRPALRLELALAARLQGVPHLDMGNLPYPDFRSAVQMKGGQGSMLRGSVAGHSGIVGGHLAAHARSSPAPSHAHSRCGRRGLDDEFSRKSFSDPSCGSALAGRTRQRASPSPCPIAAR